MKRHGIGLGAVAAALLAGCVSQGTFPSLALRPAEREDWTEEPARIAPAVADDAALRARIASLLAEAREGWREFEADLPVTERAVARGGREGSDGWIEAQQALSRLETSRGRTMQAAEALHQLRLARAEVPTSPGDLAALDAAITEVAAIAARQQQRIERISS